MTPAPDGDTPDAADGELIYIQQIHTMRECELTTLYVDYGHLLQKDDVLADAIQKQYYRFLPYLRRALLNLVTQYEPEYLKINPTAATTDSANLQSREFNIAFYHLPLVSGIRDLRTDKIGTLMSISGTVTRTSEVSEVHPSSSHCYPNLTSCSPAFAPIRHAGTAYPGNFKSTPPNSLTGKRSAFKKILPRSQPGPCRDH
jgi:DNA replicative helicase MCM subunit Mcm2 (Cdc46/Mcm family)